MGVVEDLSKEFGRISLEEILDDNSELFKGCILCYGISAIFHINLMSKAADVVNGKISHRKFSKRYGLEFNFKNLGFHQRGKLSTMREDGIFIPPQAYSPDLGYPHSNERRVSLFDADQFNVGQFDDINPGLTNMVYYDLTNRIWKPEDFANPEMVRIGLKYSYLFWKGCVKRYRMYPVWAKKYKLKNFNPSEKITKAAEKLIQYYQTLFPEPTYAK